MGPTETHHRPSSYYRTSGLYRTSRLRRTMVRETSSPPGGCRNSSSSRASLTWLKRPKSNNKSLKVETKDVISKAYQSQSPAEIIVLNHFTRLPSPRLDLLVSNDMRGSSTIISVSLNPQSKRNKTNHSAKYLGTSKYWPRIVRKKISRRLAYLRLPRHTSNC